MLINNDPHVHKQTSRNYHATRLSTKMNSYILGKLWFFIQRENKEIFYPSERSSSRWISKDLFTLELDTTFYPILTPRVWELVKGDIYLRQKTRLYEYITRMVVDKRCLYF